MRRVVVDANLFDHLIAEPNGHETVPAAGGQHDRVMTPDTEDES